MWANINKQTLQYSAAKVFTVLHHNFWTNKNLLKNSMKIVPLIVPKTRNVCIWLPGFFLCVRLGGVYMMMVQYSSRYKMKTLHPIYVNHFLGSVSFLLEENG